MAYQKEGKIKVTYQDGQEHEFTAVAACAGLDPEQVVETDEVLPSISSTSEYPVQSKAIYTALLYKADLINGTVPASQLPSYVSTIVEVPTYSDLPAQGVGDTIYVTTDTNHQYRWAGTRYVDITSENNFVSVPIQNMANMGALRTYIDGVNQQGLHCFFDFSAYVENAYVCTVLMFSKSNKNYCLIFDIINGRTFLNYDGYQDSTTVQEYVTRNEDDLIRTIKITDANTTMQDIADILVEVNDIGHHVMFDVSALNAGAYLCSIYINGSHAKIFDIVTQTSVEDDFDNATTLVSMLSRLSNVATNELLRLFPAPMTKAEFNHLKDDGWYCNWSTDQNGQWHMTVSATESGTYNFPYQSTGVLYVLTDDHSIDDMLAIVSEAQEVIESMQMVTPEQYAELEREGLIDPDVNYQIVSPDLYEFLTVTVPEQEEIRQQWLDYSITHWPWPISDSEAAMLASNGRFGVHFENGEPVCTVYASQALAEAAGERWVFQWKSGIMYGEK